MARMKLVQPVSGCFSFAVSFVQTISRRSGQLLGALFLFLCLVSPSWAQIDSTGLTGTVSDSSGHGQPGVEVTAVQDATGLQRKVASSAEGAYYFPRLPVGTYTVIFQAADFQTLRFDNVVQKLGTTRTLNVTLKIAGPTEQVDVPATPQSLDQTNNTLNTGIERIQAKELPLNGQNWATLTALVPTAVDTAGGPGAGNQRSIRYAGRGRDDNNYTYDGVDATYIINQSQPYYVRAAIPLDTIEEIRIDPILATAQTGATGGGQVAAASASGTNEFHGDAYDFLRNSAFDATDPIDSLNPNHQPPFHLNQFGGSFGGPILRDKLFFFVAYEGYQQDLGQTLIGYVPGAAFRSQVLTTSPALASVISAYPIGQNSTSNPDISQFVGEGSQKGQENSGMFRLDYRSSDTTNLYWRANIDQADYVLPYSPSSGQYLNEQEELTSYPVNSVIALAHVFSPTLVNDVKFGFNRATGDTTYPNQTGSLYAISVAGLTSLNNGRVSTNVANSFSWLDDLTWVKGRNVIKGGVEIRRIQMNQGSSSYGTISYNSPASFADNESYKASITGEYPVNGLRKTQFYGYVQDEFKWRPNFTVNLGLRYSYFGVFHEVQGRGNPFDFATCGPQGYCGVGASFGPPNYNDFDPRVSFAWAPAKYGGKMVIRSGFGIYHEDGQLDDQNIPDKNEVLSYALTSKNCPGLSFPIVLDAQGNPVCSTGTQSPNAEQRDRPDPYVTQWGLSIEQALPANFSLNMAYVGSKGTHLLQLSYVNVENPLTGLRPYPVFSQIPWRGDIGNSSYNALAISLKRSFTAGLLVSANYTWSHSIDDDSNGSGDGDSITPQNVSCYPRGATQCGERANSAFDTPNVFNANFIYELPLGAGKQYLARNGFEKAVFSYWQISSIFIARNGFPVNLSTSGTGPDGNTNSQRPNVVPAQPLYLARGIINSSAFCTPGTADPLYPGGTCPAGFGDVPRNFLRGPGVWQSDWALSRRFPLTERTQLQFRAEVFNIFNRAQYANPDGLISASDFGRIYLPLNTTPIGLGTPRQFQFLLKLQF
ncbi:MAG: carboxypeptidase regulatory-like domain-containing protein [Candidatus Korobacteraceae bacterium]